MNTPFHVCRQPYYRKRKLPDWWTFEVEPFFSDEDFIKHFRVNRAVFNYIVERITPHVQGTDTNLKKAITPSQKLCAVLYVLASGSTTHAAAIATKISQPVISRAIRDVCQAIVTTLAPDFIKLPSRPGDLMKNAASFNKLGKKGKHRMHPKGLVNVVGAIDGTHIPIRNPDAQSQEHYCRKGFPSFNCHAACGPDGVFYDVVTGGLGSSHDSSVFRDSPLYRYVIHGPPGEAWWNCRSDVQDTSIPFCLVADSAYACETCVMPAFKEHQTEGNPAMRRYNVVHARTRNVIERAFGRLKARWRMLMRKCEFKLVSYATVVMACFVLHNICETHNVPMPALDPEYYTALAAYNRLCGLQDDHNFNADINSRSCNVTDQEVSQYIAMFHAQPQPVRPRPHDPTGQGREARSAMVVYLQ